MNLVLTALILGSALAACNQPASNTSTRTPAGTTGAAQTQQSSQTSAATAAASAKAAIAAAGLGSRSAITPVLVVMGGYTSCGDSDSPINQQLASLYTTVHAAMAASSNTTPPYLLTCYSTDSTQIQYVFSTTPNLATKSGSVATMISDLAAMLATFPNPVVYMIGHSYGGWTAMDTAIQLAPSFKIGVLVTLDPISMVDCTPNNFIAANLGSAYDQGCLRSPTDFGAAALQTLAGSVGAWWNFYETSDTILHSSPIAATPNNVEKTYPSDGFTGHNDVALDPDNVTQITSIIDASLTAAGH